MLVRLGQVQLSARVRVAGTLHGGTAQQQGRVGTPQAARLRVAARARANAPNHGST